MQYAFQFSLLIFSSFISFRAAAFPDSPKITHADTIQQTVRKTKPYTLNLLASFSYSSFINSPTNAINVIVLEANCFATYRQKLFNYDALNTLRTEFGYQHLIDSTWIK